MLSICYQKVVPKVRAELTMGSSPPIVESDALCTNQFHNEIYSLIGSPIVFAGMVCLIKGVGQTS